MKVLLGLDNAASAMASSAVTLGNFDGLHLGHRHLITQLLDIAKKKSVPSVLVSFDPHPSQVLRPTHPVQKLFDQKDLENGLRELGVDYLVIEPFTSVLAQLSGPEFLRQKIIKNLNPVSFVVGHDFALGKDRLGGFAVLKKIADECGFEAQQMSAFKKHNRIVSSSWVRELLIAGDVILAAELLSRPYYITGQVQHGEGRGQKLGFPTANVTTRNEIVPQNGVYLTHFEVRGQMWPSVTNIGVRPTFYESGAKSIETHVLNYSDNSYGQNVKIHFLQRIRAELKFTDAHELIKQIRKDVEAAKKYFGG